MADRRATSQSLKSIVGASLIALGLVILFANLDGVAASLSNRAGPSAPPFPNLLHVMLQTSPVARCCQQIFAKGIPPNKPPAQQRFRLLPIPSG